MDNIVAFIKTFMIICVVIALLLTGVGFIALMVIGLIGMFIFYAVRQRDEQESDDDK
jgi:heme/copper-type cytochrome/quinol oxidase subunit 2